MSTSEHLVKCLLISLHTLLFSTCALSQTSTSADKFTEALVYARFSSEAWRCEDPAANKYPAATARKWILKAITTASEFTTTDPARQGRALDFLRDQRAALGRVAAWEKFAKDGPSKVQAALMRADLETAEKLLPQGEPPPCDLQLHTPFEKVKASRQQYQELVAEGIRVAPFQPAAALEKYRTALLIDRQDKHLGRLIQQASSKR